MRGLDPNNLAFNPEHHLNPQFLASNFIASGFHINYSGVPALKRFEQPNVAHRRPPPLNKVFTDLVESVACDRDEVLRTLEEHIVGNLVRLGPQHFLQTEVVHTRTTSLPFSTEVVQTLYRMVWRPRLSKPETLAPEP